MNPNGRNGILSIVAVREKQFRGLDPQARIDVWGIERSWKTMAKKWRDGVEAESIETVQKGPRMYLEILIVC